MAIYEPGSGFSPDPESAGVLLFPTSRTVKKNILLFLSLSAYGTLLSQPEWTEACTESLGRLGGDGCLQENKFITLNYPFKNKLDFAYIIYQLLYF